MNILHVDSSITGDMSVTRQLSAQVVEALVKSTPAARVVRRDVAAEPINHLGPDLLSVVKFQNRDGLTPYQQKELALTDGLVEEFLAADVVVIGAPMYNFTVPTQLKAWCDRIAQAGKTFKYTENGPVGLAGAKRVILASARGGVYSTNPAMAGLDFQESYVKAIMGFMGITDVTVVRAEGVSMGPAVRDAAVAAAAQEIAKL